jgi:iron complex outermembrane receptor protein
MTVAATLFYMQFKDRQVSSKDINGDFADINAGSVNNSGLELNGAACCPTTSTTTPPTPIPRPSNRTT